MVFIVQRDFISSPKRHVFATFSCYSEPNRINLLQRRIENPGEAVLTDMEKRRVEGMNFIQGLCVIGCEVSV